MAKTSRQSIIYPIENGTTKIQLIWNIFAWLDYFEGQIKCHHLSAGEQEHWILLDTKELSFSVNLNSKQDLLAADCVLTWWANMGIDHNYNEDGENIFDLDLTKKKNRDKFIA